MVYTWDHHRAILVFVFRSFSSLIHLRSVCLPLLQEPLIIQVQLFLLHVLDVFLALHCGLRGGLCGQIELHRFARFSGRRSQGPHCLDDLKAAGYGGGDGWFVGGWNLSSCLCNERTEEGGLSWEPLWRGPRRGSWRRCSFGWGSWRRSRGIFGGTVTVRIRQSGRKLNIPAVWNGGPLVLCRWGPWRWSRWWGALADGATGPTLHLLSLLESL